MNTKEASIVLGKLAFIFIASWFAIAGGCAKARGDDIWAGSGGYIGHTQDNGYYDSVWDQYGNYRGFIQKDWVNPYVPKIDRGRD
ncbi:MAG: hypothetical protein EBT03_10200 [Betaproteobacteria bacterium]|jgi:hypothetical protein|nr:hypothetical protein [Betaproteobacteria bacterium]